MAAPSVKHLSQICSIRRGLFGHYRPILDYNQVRPYSFTSGYHCRRCILENDKLFAHKSLLKTCRKKRCTLTLSNSAPTSWLCLSNGRPSYSTNTPNQTAPTFNEKLRSGPSLGDFIAASTNESSDQEILEDNIVPYLRSDVSDGSNRKVYFETYGCQMNVSDTEIAWSILQKNGFQKVQEAAQADVVLMVTCSIRENAEQKIWNRLEHFQHLKRRRSKKQPPLTVGLLGCMAERLKRKILEKSKIVDVVAGPDAYRDLPRLLSQVNSGQAAINVMLSMDETYADVIPVRLNQESKSAFVSIMRGCDNMCSYCIVPFTRGRERSRPIASILEEVRALSGQGVKEVTLLGQNVNSYRDTSESSYYGFGTGDITDDTTSMARGFNTIYKSKKGGLRFSYLLQKVSEIDPEMRVRFTSPHPKDFPDEVLYMIKEQANICNQLHLPAQSGNSDVLTRMRRGYTREAYIDLVHHVHSILPGVSLSSDFIAGFCGETEAEHQDTLSLLKLIKYNYAFLFAYSMRQKTHAYHKMKDDVPEEVKQRRLQEIIEVGRMGMAEVNSQQVGSEQLVLIEGKSKKSTTHLAGRNDGNTRVIIPGMAVAVENGSTITRPMQPGDYVAVKVTDSTSQILKGIPLYHSTLQGYAKHSSTDDYHNNQQEASKVFVDNV